MVKFEKEVKILEINVAEIQTRLEEINAKFKGKRNKKYMYMMFLHYIIDI